MICLLTTVTVGHFWINGSNTLMKVCEYRCEPEVTCKYDCEVGLIIPYDFNCDSTYDRKKK